MSRRSRRKKGAGKSPWFGKAVVALGALLIVGLGVGYMGLRAYLHSDGFRKFLSTQVSGVVKVDGNFSPFRWDGLAVETAGFDATGEGLIAGIQADEIATEIGFGGITRGVWEMKGTRITRLEVTFNALKSDEPPPVEPMIREKKVAKKQPGWVPEEVELESLDIVELALTGNTASGPVKASGMSVHVLPQTGKNAYKGEIIGGLVDLPLDFVPQLHINRVRGSFRDGSAFITKADVSAWEEGRISAFGEWNSRDNFYSFEGDVEGLKCDELLNENWARRLTGDVSSSFSLDNASGKMVMAGDLVIRNGTMTALPMLDALAAYADTRRFRMLQLSDARTKWRYSDGGILFADFVMGSEGLIRLEGNFSIKGEALDGRFRLGIVPGTLATIPGAETHVFRPGELGLLWTDIQITGTLDDPKEDLTQRLIEAAGLRMFEQIPESGEKVLKFTRSVLGENPIKAIDRGKKIIKEGENAIKEAEGIFKGLFGN
ncbi:MAG: hypothetical protein IZT59_08625 [Verrucomicrobia bacterium]|nr:hypothetical protein [Verrucomicrobiota bacterium]